MKARSFKQGSLLFASLVLSLMVGNANAQYYSSDANPSSVGTVSVVLSDSIGGACWTNLRDVREYAEEKLRQKRYTVAPDGGNYAFTVKVFGGRDKQGWCTYAITIDIESAQVVNGVFGHHVIGARAIVGNRKDNANRVIISTVQEMIGAM